MISFDIFLFFLLLLTYNDCKLSLSLRKAFAINASQSVHQVKFYSVFYCKYRS